MEAVPEKYDMQHSPQRTPWRNVQDTVKPTSVRVKTAEGSTSDTVWEPDATIYPPEETVLVVSCMEGQFYAWISNYLRKDSGDWIGIKKARVANKIFLQFNCTDDDGWDDFWGHNRKSTFVVDLCMHPDKHDDSALDFSYRYGYDAWED